MPWVNFDLAASGQPYGVRETGRHPATAKLHLDLGYLTCAVDNRAVAVPTHELDRDLVLDGMERAEVDRGLDLGGNLPAVAFTVTLPEDRSAVSTTSPTRLVGSAHPRLRVDKRAQVDWGERPAGFTSSGCGSTRRRFCGGSPAGIPRVSQ